MCFESKKVFYHHHSGGSLWFIFFVSFSFIFISLYYTNTLCLSSHLLSPCRHLIDLFPLSTRLSYPPTLLPPSSILPSTACLLPSGPFFSPLGLTKWMRKFGSERWDFLYSFQVYGSVFSVSCIGYGSCGIYC